MFSCFVLNVCELQDYLLQQTQTLTCLGLQRLSLLAYMSGSPAVTSVLS